MHEATSKLGFVTVVEDFEHGHFGGFLVLNAAGRPLEFHCTTPVKTNRAQEILYGSTLKVFLFGERIATALLAKSKTPLPLVCTDRPEILAAQDSLPIPVALIPDPAAGELPGAVLVHFGEQQVLAHSPERARDLERGWKQLAPQLELLEPFQRIREAIGEARGAHAARVA